jgi:S1-C subfamily serine protease
MLRAAASLGIAAVGGGVSLLGAGLSGNLGTRTTIRQIARAPEAAPIARTTASQGLTVEQIYRRDAPGVVQITATSVQTQRDPFGFFPPTTRTQHALGSGFVIDKAGHIVTNEHVIVGAQKVQVSFAGTDEITARVIGKDPSTDVAVLQIHAHSRSLTPLLLGNSDQVQVGDSVVAIGSPFSLTRTATAGIVSAVERTIDAPNGFSIGHAIQTDAAINHGNSGGPLIDRDGNVIGVNAQITAETEGNVGIGFAIPIDTVKAVAAQLIRNGKVRHAFLGVAAQPVTPSLARLFNLPVSHGLLVQAVTPDSAAATAGLRAGSTPVLVQGQSYALGGDIIVAVDGKAVSTQSQLREVLALDKPGDRLDLSVFQHGTPEEMAATRLPARVAAIVFCRLESDGRAGEARTASPPLWRKVVSGS